MKSLLLSCIIAASYSMASACTELRSGLGFYVTRQVLYVHVTCSGIIRYIVVSFRKKLDAMPPTNLNSAFSVNRSSYVCTRTFLPDGADISKHNLCEGI
jgi:hypothetical protein